MIIRNLIVLAVAGIVTARAAMPARGDVVIDTFQDRPSGLGAFPLTVHANVGELSPLSAYPHVLGERSTTLFGVQVISDLDMASVDISDDTAPPYLAYDSTSGLTGELYLDYTSLGLTIDPATDYIQVHFLTYDYMNGQGMQLSALVGAGLLSDPNLTTIGKELTFAGQQNINFPLNTFSDSQLNSLILYFQAPAGTNFSIGSVSLIAGVPEPTALAILISGTTLTLFRRSRRRK